MDPLIAETLEALRAAGWTVDMASPPRPLPPAIVRRYPSIPPLAVEFIAALERCERGDGGCCLFGVADYESRDREGIGWDHVERIMIEPGAPIEGVPTRDPQWEQVAPIRRFWNAHLPIFGYWAVDYEYLAIVVDPDAAAHGQVVHGYAIDFDSPGPVAPDYRAFLTQLRDVALGPPTRAAVYDNYLALLVHDTIIEDGSTPPWRKGPLARLRGLFGRKG